MENGLQEGATGVFLGVHCLEVKRSAINYISLCHQDLRSNSDSSTTSSNSSSGDSSTNGAGLVSFSSNSTELTANSHQLQDTYYSAETLAFQEALKDLRVIIGEEPSDEVLKDILMAADMDINRAVNFYFS